MSQTFKLLLSFASYQGKKVKQLNNQHSLHSIIDQWSEVETDQGGKG